MSNTPLASGSISTGRCQNFELTGAVPLAAVTTGERVFKVRKANFKRLVLTVAHSHSLPNQRSFLFNTSSRASETMCSQKPLLALYRNHLFSFMS